MKSKCESCSKLEEDDRKKSALFSSLLQIFAIFVGLL
jgi:hypothetical protein